MRVVGFAGFSGSGKTTLVEQLIPALKLRGQRVSVVKHAHHRFDIDHPGKDTWRHREAGAFDEEEADAGQRLGSNSVTIEHDDPSATRGETLRHGQPKARGSAGDQGDLAGEIAVAIANGDRAHGRIPMKSAIISSWHSSIGSP